MYTWYLVGFYVYHRSYQVLTMVPCNTAAVRTQQQHEYVAHFNVL